MTEEEFVDYLGTVAIGRGGVSVENMEKFKKCFFDLKKENEKLKEKIKGLESGEVVWKGDMDDTISQNLLLKEKIEKMKCCENCNQIWCDSRQDIQQVEKCIDDDYSLWGIKLKNV